MPRATLTPSLFEKVGSGPHISADLNTIMGLDVAGDDMLLAYASPTDDTVKRSVGDVSEGVELTCVLLDLDRPGHAPWGGAAPEASAEAHEMLQAAVALLRAAGVPAGGYTTRGGVRIVVGLDPPVAPPFAQHVTAKVQALVAETLAELTEVTGVRVDENVVAWNTSFRHPRAIRDGRRLDPLILAVPERGLPSGPLLKGAKPAKDYGGTLKLDGPMPAIGEPPSWWRFIGRRILEADVEEALATGAPLPLPPGGRNAGLFDIVARISRALAPAAGSAEDLAGAVWSVVGRSAVAWHTADPGAPTPAQAWGMAQRTAASAWQPSEVAVEPGTGPIVVQHPTGATFWAADEEGTWHGPYGPTALATRLAALRPGIVVETKGTPWAAPRIAYTYGTVVDDVVYGHKPARLDQTANVLRLQLYAAPRPAAVHHQDVADWLDQLHPRVVEWLAWADALELPLPALVIKGPRGSGKGMLAEGLAALWGGSYASWNAIAEGNDSFALAPALRSPLVYGDEVTGLTNVKESGLFRSLTGNTTHEVNEKRIPRIQIQTALRVFWATNDAHVLSIRGTHTQDSIEAVRARVVAVVDDGRAADFLASRGGRRFTADWVAKPDGSPGKLAEHIMWLQTQRPEEWSGRFPVEAWVAPELSHGALVGNDHEMAVWNVIAKAIIRGNQEIATIEDEIVYVDANACYNQWAGIMNTTDGRPAIPSLHRYLRQRSGKAVAFRTGRRYPVPIEIVRTVAGELALDIDERAGPGRQLVPNRERG